MKTYKLNGVEVSEERLSNLIHSAASLFFGLPCRQDHDCLACDFMTLCPQLAELMGVKNNLQDDKGDTANDNSKKQ